MKRTYLLGLFVLLGCFFTTAIGQTGSTKDQIKIEIAVTNSMEEPIEGAKVYGNEGAVYSLTNSAGFFTLTTARDGMVLIEADGYIAKTFSIAFLQVSKSIVLEKSPAEFKRDVNMPFGSLSNDRIIGSVSNLHPSELTNHDARGTVQSALTGYVPGLFKAGNIWGMGDALLVVDGVPRTNVFDYNLEEIEEITVLKDATSKLMYGSLADQGVVLITTKRGAKHKKLINVSGEFGVATPIAYPEFLNSAQQLRLYSEAQKNDGINPSFSDDDIAGYERGASLQYPDEDYYSSKYLKNQHNTSRVMTEFSGGNDIAQYYLNMGWNHSGGLEHMTSDERQNQDRFNVRANVDCKLNDFIKLQVDGFFLMDKEHGPVGNYWTNAATLRPDRYPMLIHVDSVQTMIKDGESFSADEFKKQAELIDGAYVLGGTSQYTTNIYGDQFLGGYYDLLHRTVQVNTGLEVDMNRFVKGLSMNMLYGFNAYNQHRVAQNNSYAVYEPVWNTASNGSDSLVVIKQGTDNFIGSQGISEVSFERLHSFFASINYKRSFGIHNLSATLNGIGLLYSYEDKVHPGKYLNYGLRVNYKLLDRYVVEFGSALVGSPLLAKENRWGITPAIGAGWIISEEDFLKGSSLVNYLKIRVGYGIVNTTRGFNDTYYTYSDTYDYSAGAFTYKDGVNKNQAIHANFVESPELNFEKRKELTAGFEASLLTNQIWIEAGYFHSLYDGIFTDPTATYPTYLGTRPRINYNSELTTGYEGGIRINKKLGDFSFTIGSNFVYAMPVNVQIDEQNFEAKERKTEGRASDGIYGYVFDRFYTEADFNEYDELNSNIPRPAFGSVQPGDLKYVDIFEDGVIDENDQKLIGNNKERFQYSIHLNLRYKNFELFAIGTGSTGAESSLVNNQYYHVYGADRYSTQALDRWTPGSEQNASHPRLTTIENSNNHKQSTFWLYSRDRFDLHTLQLTYNLPSNTASFLKGAQVYVRASNLLTIAGSKDILTVNIKNSPQTRVVALGLKMNL